MANWTNIPTDRIEPGKPIRAIDGLALRDNPIAIAEGASGAPKIREEAISTNSINGNRLRTNSVTNDRLANRTITQAKLAEGTGERDWVGRRIASMSAGAVGTYAFVSRTTRSNSTGRVLWGGTAPGSTLRAALVSGVDYTLNNQGVVLTGNENMNNPFSPVTLSGTWRIMGLATGGRTGEHPFATLALRIA